MKKIFPFYKDKNISNNPLGYSNANNTRKRMNSSDVWKDFIKTLPEHYWFEYYYTYELEKPWNEDIKPGKYRINESHHLFNITIYTDGYIKYKKIKFKELPVNVQELFRKKLSFDDLYCADNNPETKEAYREILYGILKAGYYPYLWKDETDYIKQYNKFVKENVEFREMDVEITITD